jgi:tRNA pseudouridine13 synthase
MKLKEQPEDFYVREIIDLSKKEPGETFQYFLMRKRNLTTLRAIKIVSKKLKISKKRISFAGEKDKKAVTEQYISIKGLKNFKEYYDFGNVKLMYVGSFAEPVRISDIDCNYFEIKVREVSQKELDSFVKYIELYKYGFVNYFDEQRFGDIRCNNHLIGKELVRRNWEGACKILLTFDSDKENSKATNARVWLKYSWGKWRESISMFPKWLDVELAVLNHLVNNPNDFLGALKKLHKRLLKMFVHAYQSYIWNLTVSRFVENECRNTKALKLAFGSLSVPSERECIKKLKDVEIPIVGYDTELENLNPQVKTIIEEILSEEGIKLDDFFFVEVPYLSSEGHQRKVIEVPKDLEYDLERDVITLKFKLSRGVYATMFVKHLFLV